MNGLRLLYADLKPLGFCCKGARVWFAESGINWSLFLKEGVELERLEATADPRALAAVAHVRKRVADGR